MARVSIIIPTLNEQFWLPRCLESLGKQTLKDFEVIIVDSGSSDRTVSIARKHGARVLYEPKLGFAVAKNFGAGEAEGEILVFTDADSEYPRDWLRRLVDHFDEKGVVAAFGPLKPMEPKLLHRVMFRITTDFVPRISALFGFYIAQAPNQAFRRSAFEKIGGFDERLRMLEDNELPNRIKFVGKVVFDSGLWVFSSARRFEKEGYLASTKRFLEAYWKIYFQKKAAAEDYPLYR